jgi:uncharacterized membrane protein YraQ (UPF0718 family)
MIKSFADWLVYGLLQLTPGTRLGEALNFFVYDTIKIIFLLFIMTVVMGFVNSYFPVEKVRAFLTRRKWFGLDHLLASVFGAITPFCSCSSIPLFIGFLKGGIPLGVTLSFLVTSPLVNEVAFAVFVGIFGWKVAVIYAGSGILLGTIVGAILGKIKLEPQVENWVWRSVGQVHGADPAADTDRPKPSIQERLPAVVKEAFAIIKGILPYLLIGIGIGAAIHGFIPTGYFEKWITKENPLAVPIAVLLGVPMYANATGVVPILQALVDKGIPLGTALAFSMAVVGLSLPEATLLRKVMKPRLIIWYFGSVSFSIILLGYIFNLVL